MSKRRSREEDLERLAARIRACRHCVEAPSGPPLPHEPRAVLRISSTARLGVCSQAPGARAHQSGVPFTDPSGDRLRVWMGVTPAEFYDERRVAIIPMGFCFPGYDANGGDLPPRRECAKLWHQQLFAKLPQLELVLLVGSYSQRWHLKRTESESLTGIVSTWRSIVSERNEPRYLPLPHPSWRNNGWLKRNPWFEAELLPVLRAEVRHILEG